MRTKVMVTDPARKSPRSRKSGRVPFYDGHKLFFSSQNVGVAGPGLPDGPESDVSSGKAKMADHF